VVPTLCGIRGRLQIQDACGACPALS
jgi:hypothetical protein